MVTNVNTFSTGIRVTLGAAQGDLKAQVTDDAVKSLLDAAANHPGYQAHADRYEFRLRNLNGQAVLELKEKNWASSFKFLSGDRRSQERKAAGQAISQMFGLDKNFGADRLDGAGATTFAQHVKQVHSLKKSIDENQISFANRHQDDWFPTLETTLNKSKDSGIDEESGLYKNGIDQVKRSTLHQDDQGFTLTMGTQKPSGGAGASQGPDLKDLKFSVAATVDQFPHSQEALIATRNLTAMLRSGLQMAWLVDLDSRFSEQFGDGVTALINPQEPSKTEFRVEKNHLNGVTVTATLSGTLDAKFRGAEQFDMTAGVLGQVDFETTVQFSIKKDDICKDDFDISKITMVSSEESFETRYA